MSKKQTAVEWFAQQVLSYKSSTNINGTDYILIPINKVEFLKTKAKQMEKESIDYAWRKYRDFTNNEDAWSFKEWLKKYYHE